MKKLFYMYLNTWCMPDCTLGRLRLEDKEQGTTEFQCFTLELPWKENARNVSCIPCGDYPAIAYASPSKGDVLLLKDVINRTFIEIHAGNFTSQIRGCILVGDGLKDINHDGIPDVTNSRNTLKRLLEVVGDSYVSIEIIRN